MGCSRARAILLVHPVTPRELQPSPRAQDQLGWTTSDGAPRKPLTGAIIPFWVLGLFVGFSLSGDRFEVALVGRLRYLVTDRPILKRWEAILSPVVLAAPIPAGDVSVGSTPRSLYRPRPSASVAALSRPSVRSVPATWMNVAKTGWRIILRPLRVVHASANVTTDMWSSRKLPVSNDAERRTR